MHDRMDSFRRVLKALHEYEVEYVLIGGLAAIFHGVPRVTQDLDIFIRMNDSNVKALVDALHSVFKDKSVYEIAGEDISEYPVTRFGTPDNYFIDIMIRIGEMFEYDDLKFEIVERSGFPVRIATIETLIKLKENTVRTIDKADVLMLTDILKRKK